MQGRKRTGLTLFCIWGCRKGGWEDKWTRMLGEGYSCMAVAEEAPPVVFWKISVTSVTILYFRLIMNVLLVIDGCGHLSPHLSSYLSSG